jgi:hypothetical protein
MVTRLTLTLAAGIAAVLLLGSPRSASAEIETTWDQASAQIGFPLYRPQDTLGLELSSLTTFPCSPAPLPSALSAIYGDVRRGPFLTLLEAYPSPCGNRGEARRVGSVEVAGTRVPLFVSCGDRACRVTRADAFANGFELSFREPGRKRTLIELSARRRRLRDVLRMARNLTRVPVTGPLQPPTVHLHSFRSPDRKVWCSIANDYVVEDAWCLASSTASGHIVPNRFGRVRRDGTVETCSVVAPQVCGQNWDSHAPVLRAGQRSELGGFRCRAEATAITCTTIAPDGGDGSGFRIDAAGVAPVGPPPA